MTQGIPQRLSLKRPSPARRGRSTSTPLGMASGVPSLIMVDTVSTKAQPVKAGAAKPRVLASSATSSLPRWIPGPPGCRRANRPGRIVLRVRPEGGFYSADSSSENAQLNGLRGRIVAGGHRHGKHRPKEELAPKARCRKTGESGKDSARAGRRIRT